MNEVPEKTKEELALEVDGDGDGLVSIELARQFARDSAPDHRTISLFGEIGPEASYTVWNALQQFQLEDQKAPVTIFVSTPGGSLHDALSIWDAIQACVCPVWVVGVGEVMSAGAFIMYAGDKGHRYLAPNATIMVHQMAFGHAGRMTSMRNRLKSSEKQQNRFLDLMAERANLRGGKATRRKKLEKCWLAENDVYMFPEEAIELVGLADHIGLPNLLEE